MYTHTILCTYTLSLYTHTYHTYLHIPVLLESSTQHNKLAVSAALVSEEAVDAWSREAVANWGIHTHTHTHTHTHRLRHL